MDLPLRRNTFAIIAKVEGSNKRSTFLIIQTLTERPSGFYRYSENALFKGLRTGKSEENALCDLLLEYRVVPHVATNEARAKMLVRRNLQNTLDVLRTGGERTPMSRYQRQMKSDYDKRKKERLFKVGQEAFVRNYSNMRDRWFP